MKKFMQKPCLPCTNFISKLGVEEQAAFLLRLHADWRIAEGHHLERSFKFPDFKSALSFTNKIGEIAEEQGHHPDIILSYGKVVVKIWTHKIDNLSESDFILAALIDSIEISKKVCF